MEPQGHQNQKKGEKRSTPKNYKKTALLKVGSWCILVSFWDSPFAPEMSPKSPQSHKNLNMGPRTSKMSPRASEMSPGAPKMPKNYESNLPKTKKGTVAG